MTNRIERYLDGTLDWRDLTPDEQEDARVAERAIEETRAFVSGKPPRDIAAGVMRRIHELGAAPATPASPRFLGALAERIWAPRYVEVEWRPAYAVLAAAIVVLLFVFGPSLSTRPAPAAPSPVAATADTRLFVQFRLNATDAVDVRLAGSFTNWEPRYELHETSPGVWTITLPLTAGVHDYAFVVNGQRWIPDPYAPHVDDGFGGVNSRIAVLAPDPPRS